MGTGATLLAKENLRKLKWAEDILSLVEKTDKPEWLLRIKTEHCKELLRHHMYMIKEIQKGLSDARRNAD